ncbi:hypothetical protein PENTCL1PPCAC_4563, partial [Pristionchus entomophagus]
EADDSSAVGSAAGAAERTRQVGHDQEQRAEADVSSAVGSAAAAAETTRPAGHAQKGQPAEAADDDGSLGEGRGTDGHGVYSRRNHGSTIVSRHEIDRELPSSGPEAVQLPYSIDQCRASIVPYSYRIDRRISVRASAGSGGVKVARCLVDTGTVASRSSGRV